MTVNESKFIIQKLIKYSMEELEMAEHYQRMMAHMEDSSAFSKFKEFATKSLLTMSTIYQPQWRWLKN